MRVSSLFVPLTALALAGHASALPSKRDTQAQRANAVKEAFQTAWDGYYTYAFPHDQLHPEDNTFDDSYDGWGASAVDALSTAVVMGNSEVVNQIVDYIPKINFKSSPAGVNTISLFETTIRYLGGLLAGYDLLSGPASNMVSDKSKVKAILTQAKSLADTLKYAFDTPSGIPYNNLNINTKGNDGSKTNGLATIGTLMLEWTHLSDLTNDKEYAQLSQKAESHLLNPQPAWAQPFPGLVGTNVAIDTGLFQDDYVSWCGGDDSFYEYLIKFWVYDQSRFSEYRDRWVSAAESTMAKLTSHPTTRPDLTFVSIYNNGTYQDDSQHLTGFIGGNFLLAGSVLGRQDLIDYGLKLTAAWHDTYASTATHIGPEQFSWNASAVPSDQAAFFQKNGFYITSSNYVLRPEIMESYYYAYRITGNHTYADWAWDAFVAINATTRVGSGYSGLQNVNVAGGGGYDNVQESFFFAEVLKYAYLIQADDADFQVKPNGKNLFVFNTEAHPLKVVSS